MMVYFQGGLAHDGGITSFSEMGICRIITATFGYSVSLVVPFLSTGISFAWKCIILWLFEHLHFKSSCFSTIMTLTFLNIQYLTCCFTELFFA